MPDPADSRLGEEVYRVRQRLNDVNDLHYRNIRDQLDLAWCKMMELLDTKLELVEAYAQNLRKISNDDVGQALLDNVLEQTGQIGKELRDSLEYPDETTDLEGSNNALSKNRALLDLINRLARLEAVLDTHVGEPTDEGN